jgi:phosphatidylethanolamine-binding protein (PEBP) family uncharacterized protein
MKKVNFITAIVLLCTTAIFAQKIHFHSKNLEASNQVEEFNGFGCSGENFSPQLSWSNAPERRALPSRCTIP